MTSNTPWIHDKKEQPEFSNDIFPMCFFQLQTLDEQNDSRNKGNGNYKVSDKHLFQDHEEKSDPL